MPGCIEHGVKEWAATGQRPNRDTGLCGEDATVSLSRTPLSVKRMIVPSPDVSGPAVLDLPAFPDRANAGMREGVSLLGVLRVTSAKL